MGLAESPVTSILNDLRLSDYLDIARRRKWWIILSALAMLIASAVVAHRLKNVYRAETTILVDASQVPYNYVAPVVSTDISARLTTLQEQDLSPTRLAKLVEAEGLYPDPRGKRTEDDVIRSVQKAITFEVVNPGGGKMGAFRIAYSSDKQDEVSRVANRLASMFIEENLKAREEQTSGTAQFLEDQMTETKRQLDVTDNQLQAIKARNVLDLPEAKPYHMEALATLRGQVQNIQDKISQDQRDKAILQSMLLSGGPAPTIDVDSAYGENDSGLPPDQVQIQKLETRLAELQTRYGPAHPEVRRTQHEITQLKEKIANASSDSLATTANQKPAIQPNKSSPRNPVLQDQIEKLDDDVKEQSGLLSPLQQRIEFHTAKLAEEPVFEQKITNLQQNYEALKKQYAGLLDKKQAADLSYALEVRQKAEKFVVLDAAKTPQKPAAPNRPLISFAGLMGGLLLGAALAAGVEMNDETVRSETEVARILGKPVLSGIPRLVSAQERKVLWMRVAGMLAGTVISSLALGLLLSMVAGRFF
jgi:succinoglycan biosynthesis transport protein ExoP